MKRILFFLMLLFVVQSAFSQYYLKIRINKEDGDKNRSIDFTVAFSDRTIEKTLAPNEDYKDFLVLVQSRPSSISIKCKYSSSYIFSYSVYHLNQRGLFDYDVERGYSGTDSPIIPVIYAFVIPQQSFEIKNKLICVDDGSGSIRIGVTKIVGWDRGYHEYFFSDLVLAKVKCQGLTHNFKITTFVDTGLSYSRVQAAFGNLNIMNKELTVEIGYQTDDGYRLKYNTNGIVFIPTPNFNIENSQLRCSYSSDARITIKDLPDFEKGEGRLQVNLIKQVKDSYGNYKLDDEVSRFLDNITPGQKIVIDNNTIKDWDNENTDPDHIFQLTSGRYVVQAFFDTGKGINNLCPQEKRITIEAPAPIIIESIEIDEHIAQNGTKEKYHIKVNGGTASGSITIKDRKSATHYCINQGISISNKQLLSETEKGSTYKYDISGLKGGSNSIRVTATGCLSNIYSINLTQAPELTEVTSVAHDISCFGEKGSVSFTITGGFGPYKVALSSGVIIKNLVSVNGSFTNLNRGNYTTTVTDEASGKFVENMFSITEPEPLVLTVNKTDVSCNGANNGTIELSAKGGTGSHTFSIYIGNEKIPSNNLLSPGTYTCKVVDKNGCEVSKEVTINQPAVLSLLELIVNKASCSTASNGSVSFIFRGGHDLDAENGELSVTLLKGSTNIPVNPDFNGRNFTISGLSPGSYNISVTNDIGCAPPATSPFTISTIDAGSQFKVSLNDIKHESCSGKNNAELKIDLTNGIPFAGDVYHLKVDGTNKGNYSPNSYITGLGAGVYDVSITDASNCTAILNDVAINIDPNTLQITDPTIIKPTCSTAKNGKIILQGKNGLAPDGSLTSKYLYSLDGGDYVSSNKFIERLSKSYSYSVKDDAGCIVHGEVDLNTNAEPISFDLNVIDESCETADNGKIQINNLIHDAGLTMNYELNGTPKSPDAPNEYTKLNSGIYEVTISDDNKCFSTKDISIVSLGQFPTISNIIDTKLACESASNGAIDVDVSTIYPSTKLTYGLIDANNNPVAGELFDNTKFVGLTNQTYKFIATDENTCSSSLDINVPVSENAVKFTNEEWISATCIDASNGIINVEASEGVPDTFGYTFTFNGEIKQAYTAQFIGLAVGTSGVVTVTDATGCTAETALQTVVVREKVLQITAVDKTDPVCFGTNSGEIRLTVENAIGTLTYSIEKRNESNVYIPITSTYDVGSNAYKNLDFGVYKVIVNDEDACNTFFEGIELLNPEKAELTASSYNYIEVKGEATGEYEITLVGINKSFTYELKNITFGEPGVVIESGNLFYDSGYEIKKKFESLAAGKYRFTLTDDNACLDFNGSDTFTEEFSIKEPEFELSYTDELLTYVSCNGLSDGAISISGFGGWGEYSYSLNGGLWQNNGSFSNLVAGNYSIEIRDREETIITYLITITEPDVFSFAIDKYKDATCPAYANGQVLASSTNGIPFSEGLHYWIENTDDRSIILGDSHSGNSYVFKELPKGNYELFVSDSHNCSDKRSFSIEEPEPAVIEYTNNYIKAKGDASGEISMSITGGNGLFDYECLLNDEIIAFESGQTTEAIQLNNLLAGTYHILVRDTAACVYEAEEWMKRTIEIKEPELALGAEVKEKSEVSCYSLSDGLIAVDAVGGWGDYSYSLDGGAWQKDGTYSNLIVGDYSILIRDSVDISYLHEFIISEPDTLNLEIDLIKDATCPNYANGRVLATSSNGVPFGNGLHYWIENSDDNSIVLGDQFSDNSYQFKQLPEGNYELFVSDSHSCEASKTFSIKEPEPAKIELTHNYIKAKGNAAGEISLKLSGGNGTFDYECYLNNSSETYEQGQVKSEITLNNLLAGTYQIFVRDTAGCVYEDKEWMERIVEMREPDLALSFDIEEQRDVTCFGLTDGYIKLKAIGGWGDYRFQLNANPQIVFDEFTDLPAAIYQLQITDSVGISWAQEISIIEPNLLTAEYLLHKDVNCFGGNDGEITLKIEGGNPEYNLSLNETDWITGFSMTKLVKADYDIFVKDNKGCEVKVETIKIDQPDEITLLSSLVTKSRCSNNEGSIVTAFFGGVGQYTYQWNKDTLVNGAFVWKDIPNSNSPAIDNLFSSQYIVKVRDEHLCELSFDFALGDITDLTIESIDVEDVSCWGYKDGKASALVKNGNSPYIYSWDVDITESNKDLAWDILAGTYNLLVRDDKGCAVSEKFTVGSPDPLSYQIDEIVQPLCYGGEKGVINLHAVGGTADYQYSWNDGRTASSIEELNPDLYSLTIKDAHNCESTFDFEMKYQRELTPFIGNDTLICHYNTLLLDGGDYSEYSWSSDFGFSSQKAQIDLTEPGKYYLEVTDEDQCLGFDTLSLDVSYFKIADMVSTDVTCNDFADGRAQVELTPLNWESKVVWPNGRNGLVWDKLSGGNYTVEVEDSYACKDSHDFFIYEPDTLSVDVEKLLHPICSDVPNGEIELIANGGNGTYLYLWNNGSDKAKISDLDQGIYSVLIEDQKHCQISKSYDLKYQKTIQNDLGLDFLGPDTLICHYNSLPLDGRDFAKHYWTSDLGYSSSKRFVELNDPDNYYLQIEDEDKCFAYDTIKLSVSYLKIKTLASTDVTCNSFADGNAQIAVLPANWKHVIEWSDGSHASTWNNLSGGDYQVQITDDYGCFDIRKFSIYEPNELKIEVENLFHPLCFGVPDGFIRLNPLGGNEDYQFVWNHGSDKSRLTKLDQGDYSVLLTDKKGCQVSDNFTLEYQKAIYPDLGEDVIICSNNFVSLYPGNYSEYLWMEDNRILDNTESDLVVWDANEYSVEAKDEDGCTASDTINISVIESELNPVLLSASSVAVGDTLMVMDVSQPQPESLTWEFTGPHTITEQTGFYCLVVFSEEGMYEMKMSALLNDCVGELRESILVVPASEKADDGTETQFEAYVHLKKLIVAPNPSYGNFAANVELAEIAEITFYLVNLQNGQIIEKRRRSGLKTYRENYSVSQSGSYCVYAESKGERKVVKLIVL